MRRSRAPSRWPALAIRQTKREWSLRYLTYFRFSRQLCSDAFFGLCPDLWRPIAAGGLWTGGAGHQTAIDRFVRQRPRPSFCCSLSFNWPVKNMELATIPSSRPFAASVAMPRIDGDCTCWCFMFQIAKFRLAWFKWILVGGKGERKRKAVLRFLNDHVFPFLFYSYHAFDTQNRDECVAWTFGWW